MKTPATKMVRIAEPKGQPTLSKGQKLFNKLIKEVEAARKRLAEWQATIPLYQQKRAKEIEPLQQSYDEHRIKLIYLLDKAFGEKKLTATEKSKLSEIICNVASALLVETKDEGVKELYNKHSGGDYDVEQAEDSQMARTMLEEMMGVDFGDDDIDFGSMDDVKEQLAKKMMEKLAQEEQDRQNRQEESGKRKKSAKVMAQEARQAEEEKNISQSIREVYRKLASALHPDREQDEGERARKTKLMQQVNVAYADKDLLRLLELQLEVEQIDQHSINSINEDRLKYYNKILREQADELKQEITGLQFGFRMRFDISPDASLTTKNLLRDQDREIAALKRDILDIEGDLQDFQKLPALKIWLKSYRLAPKGSFMDFLMDDDPFGDAGFGSPF